MNSRLGYYFTVCLLLLTNDSTLTCLLLDPIHCTTSSQPFVCIPLPRSPPISPRHQRPHGGLHPFVPSSIHAPLTTTAHTTVAWVAAAHLLVLLAAPRFSLAQTGTDYDDGTGGTGDRGAQAIAGSPIVARAMNERLRALTSSFAKAIGKQLDYCIKDT
jgi:hypothetical protein